MIEIIPISELHNRPDICIKKFKYIITIPGLHIISTLKEELEPVLEAENGIIIREMLPSHFTKLYFSNKTMAVYYKLCSKNLL